MAVRIKHNEPGCSRQRVMKVSLFVRTFRAKDSGVDQQTAEVWLQIRVSLRPEGSQVLVPSGLARREIRVMNL